MQAITTIDRAAETVPTTATLRFRQSQGSLGVSRHGRIRPGGRLVVEYDPARLARVATPQTRAQMFCATFVSASRRDPQRERVGACSHARGCE
jgi:hypothetical protein